MSTPSPTYTYMPGMDNHTAELHSALSSIQQQQANLQNLILQQHLANDINRTQSSITEAVNSDTRFLSGDINRTHSAITETVNSDTRFLSGDITKAQVSLNDAVNTDTRFLNQTITDGQKSLIGNITDVSNRIGDSVEIGRAHV